MDNSFQTFVEEIENEAKIEGPEAVEQLNTLRKFFKEQVKKALLKKEPLIENDMLTIELTAENLIEIAGWFGFKKEQTNESG